MTEQRLLRELTTHWSELATGFSKAAADANQPMRTRLGCAEEAVKALAVATEYERRLTMMRVRDDIALRERQRTTKAATEEDS